MDTFFRIMECKWSQLLDILIELDVDLKHGGWLKYPLHFARVTFDVVMADYPSLAHHFCKDTRIVENKYFDNWSHKNYRKGQLNSLENNSLCVLNVGVIATLLVDGDYTRIPIQG